MIIPYTELEHTTLTALIEEFACRDGTDYGEQECSLAEKVVQIRRLLGSGKLVISYDPDTETCALKKA